MEAYLVDLDSLQFHAPPGTSLPARLLDFLSFCGQTAAGAFGWFRLRGDRLDDFYVEDGSRLAEAFASFLRCADGSCIGFFRPAGEDLDAAEIALFGSDGDVRLLARTFDGFRTSASVAKPTSRCSAPTSMPLAIRSVADADGLRADQARLPRSAYWTPRWLADALAPRPA